MSFYMNGFFNFFVLYLLVILLFVIEDFLSKVNCYYLYLFQVFCECNLCKNGGICVLDYQKYEYKCVCVRSIRGSYCDKCNVLCFFLKIILMIDYFMLD